MKQNHVLIVITLILWTTQSATAISFFETFDSNVGVFAQTIGNGATDYPHDAVSGDIEGRFVRATTPNARLAPLGQIFNEDVFVRFGADLTPRSILDGGRPRIGLFDSSTGSPRLVFEFDNNPLVYGPLTLYGSSNHEFDFAADLFYNIDDTYRVEVEYNGLQRLLRQSVWLVEPSGTTLLRSEVFNVQSTVSFTFDAAGMGNIVDASGQGAGATFAGDVDNYFLFISDGRVAVPEPAAVCLIGLAVVVMACPTRRSTSRMRLETRAN